MGPPLTWPYSHPAQSDSGKVQSDRKCLSVQLMDNLKFIWFNCTFLFLLVQVLLSLSLVGAGPVVLNLDYLQGPVHVARNIRHLPCISRRTGQEGVCMFAIDCLKANGSHLGTCIDRFYFGSCCQIPDKTLLPQIITNNIEDNTIDGATFVHPQTEDKTTTLSKADEVTERVTDKDTIADRTEPDLETKSDELTTIDNKINDNDAKLTTVAIVETTTKAEEAKPSDKPVTDVPMKLSTFQTVSGVNSATDKPIEEEKPTTNQPKPTVSRKPIKPSYKPRPSYRPSNFTRPTLAPSTLKPRPTKPVAAFNTTRKPPYRLPPKRPSTKKPLPSPPRLNITILPQSTSSKPIFTRPSSVSITYINTTSAEDKPISISSTTSTTTPTTTTTTISTTTTTTESATTERNTETTELITETPTPTERMIDKSTEGIITTSESTTIETAPTEPNQETTVEEVTEKESLRPITQADDPVTATEDTNPPATITAPTETTPKEPITSSTTPITSSSAPITSSTAPITSSSAPITSSTAPITSSIAPITSSSAPITSSTALITSSSAPITSSTTPIITSPAPVTSAAPVTLTTDFPPLVTWSNTEDATTKAPEKVTEPNQDVWSPITPPEGWVLISKIPPKPESTSSTTTPVTFTTSIPQATVQQEITEKVPSSSSTPASAEVPISNSPIAEVLKTTPQMEFIVNVTLSPTVPTTTTSAGLSTFTAVTINTTLSDVSSTTTSDTPSSPEPTTTPASVETTTEFINMSNYKEVCGRRLWQAPEGRIVGGAKSGFGQWPWQISLRQFRTSTYLHKCGAALLNENWAITAAHCVENHPPSELLVRLGEHDLANDDEPYGFAERRVQIVASHPHFDPATFEYDLALLRFYEPVNFQPNILPICVPDNDDDYVGRTAYVTGWGRLFDEGPLPSVLQEVEVPVINNSACEAMYQAAGYNEHIPNIFICAGQSKGGADSCEGDSGGPMVIRREKDNRFVLGGVISWGIGCAEPNQPGVYTRISEFRDWINQILQF